MAGMLIIPAIALATMPQEAAQTEVELTDVTTEETEELTEDIEVVEEVEEVAADEGYSLLWRICTCESSLGTGKPQQYEADGYTVLTGRVDPRDTGMCQINTHYHLETAERLGYDIFTAVGNWGYATYLFDTQGVQPWMASASCWNK